MSESLLLTYLKAHPSKLVKTPGLFMARWNSFKQQKKSKQVSVKFELIEQSEKRMFFDFKTPDGGTVRMQFTTKEAELSYLKWVAAGGLSEDEG